MAPATRAFALIAAVFGVFVMWDKDNLEFLRRITRNAFLSGVPQGLERVYPIASPEDLSKHITVVASAKDFLSQAPEMLAHLTTRIPADMHVIFTYPKPVHAWNGSYEEAMRKAAGPLRHLQLLELEAFANPFRGWIEAEKLVKTKYTLLMHNDVFPVEEHFVSELYGALEAHPECVVAAPQIYEAEEEGMLVAHTINTNLHMRRKPHTGALYLSHEVDLVKGTNRHPSDFKEGIQSDFLEDHAFLARTPTIPVIVDPEAAFTLEYMDLQLSTRASNSSVWFVPSASVEFRVWGTKFRWQDVIFFAYRRSERLARQTKAYLERKWKVEFPNTGFANFVKFSVVRSVKLTAEEGAKYPLPPVWSQQAAMVAGWFEWVGFNSYRVLRGVRGSSGNDWGREMLLPELLDRVQDLGADGARFKVGRELVDIPPVLNNESALAGHVLEVWDRQKKMETRLPFSHLPLALAKISFKGGCNSAKARRVAKHAGLVIESADGSCQLWLYLAPFNYDNVLLRAGQALMRLLKMPQRVAVYVAMKAWMIDLEKKRHEIEHFAALPNVDIVVCGENDRRCEAVVEFPESAQLLQWSGALPSWPTVKQLLTTLPGSQEAFIQSDWSVITLFIMCAIVILHVSRMSRRCFVWTLSALCGGWSLARALELSVPGVVPAVCFLGVVLHLPVMPRKCVVSTVTAVTVWFVAFRGWLPGTTAQDVLLVSSGLLGLLALRRVYLLLYTMRASAVKPLVFPMVSRLLPSYSFGRRAFFRADGCPEDVAARREKAFETMRAHWAGKWPKTLETSKALRSGFSDLRFASANRVFLPFKKMLEDWCDPCTAVVRSEGVALIDQDNHRLVDVSGSYGVNVCGYEAYKSFLAEGMAIVKDLGCVLGPVHTLLRENIEMLKKISGQDEVSLHMSGTEAVQCAVRLARFNTNRRLIVVFDGAYHGWWDGVQTLAGNERLPGDVLTLTDMSPATLKLLSLRGKEIAAVLVNPLQSFHPNAPPPSDLTLASNSRSAGGAASGGMSGEERYGAWLKKLRAACSAQGIVLVFDEVYTGFRLAIGGAQEYFGIKADMVCYGKTLGGGMPNGVVCGPAKLMRRTDPAHPLRVAYVIGTFSAHPPTLACMNAFLRWVTSSDAKPSYERLKSNVASWVVATNEVLVKEGIPLQVAAYGSVWTMLFLQPGRYHWILQYYLKDEGLNLSWVGTGRLNFSLDFGPEELSDVRDRIVRACKRVRDDGWWWQPKGGLKPSAIKRRVVKEILGALVGCSSCE